MLRGKRSPIYVSYAITIGYVCNVGGVFATVVPDIVIECEHISRTDDDDVDEDNCNDHRRKIFYPILMLLMLLLRLWLPLSVHWDFSYVRWTSARTHTRKCLFAQTKLRTWRRCYAIVREAHKFESINTYLHDELYNFHFSSDDENLILHSRKNILACVWRQQNIFRVEKVINGYGIYSKNSIVCRSDLTTTSEFPIRFSLTVWHTFVLYGQLTIHFVLIINNNWYAHIRPAITNICNIMSTQLFYYFVNSITLRVDHNYSWTQTDQHTHTLTHILQQCIEITLVRRQRRSRDLPMRINSHAST